MTSFPHLDMYHTFVYVIQSDRFRTSTHPIHCVAQELKTVRYLLLRMWGVVPKRFPFKCIPTSQPIVDEIQSDFSSKSCFQPRQLLCRPSTHTDPLIEPMHHDGGNTYKHTKITRYFLLKPGIFFMHGPHRSYLFH